MALSTAYTEKKMSFDEYSLLKGLIQKECGICLNDDKLAFLSAKVLKRMRLLNVCSFYRYYKLLLEEDSGKEELCALIDSVTINETAFFRNRPQMELFSEVALPEILARKHKDIIPSLTVWSAGCSMGQEPYSIAMILHETIPDIDKWRVRVMATDLSPTALRVARAGVYGPDKMEGVNPSRVRKYFQRTGDSFRVKDEIRKMVVFDSHNLMQENELTDVDIIFCRNVLIYFNGKTQCQVIEKFYDVLAPGGYIFLGHAESLGTLNERFVFIHHNKGTAYRRKA